MARVIRQSAFTAGTSVYTIGLLYTSRHNIPMHPVFDGTEAVVLESWYDTEVREDLVKLRVRQGTVFCKRSRIRLAHD